jgi:hypothetical protein
VFAVSKLGAFLSMLVRIGATMKELGALGSLKAILGGNFRSEMGRVMGQGSTEAAAIAEAHAQGAAEVGGAIRAAFAEGAGVASQEIAAGEAEGGAAAAAEIRTAEIAGGAAAGGESALGGAAAGAAGGGLLSRVGRFFGLSRGAGAAAAGEMGIAEEGAVGLSTALGGVALSAGALTAGVGLLAVGLTVLAVHFLGGKDAATRAGEAFMHNLHSAQQLHVGFLRLRGGLEQVGSSYASTRLNLEQARRALNSTAKGTMEHRVALQQYRQALIENNQAQQQFTTLSKGMQSAADRELATRKKVYDQYVKSGGPQVVKDEKARLDALKQSGASQEAIAKQQSVYNAALQRYNSVIGPYNAALNNQAVAADNAARAYRGMALLGGQAAQQVGALARTAGGGTIAKKISLKFEAPKDAGAVAASAKKALGAGVSQKVILRILGDSSNAEQAIKRINAARILAKHLQIRVDQGEALAALARMRGIKLSPKILRLLHEGDPSVINAVKRIIGLHVPNKVLTVTGAIGSALAAFAHVKGLPNIAKILAIAGHDAASGVWRSVVSAIGGFGTIVKNIIFHGSHTGATHAAGGIEDPVAKKIMRAADTAGSPLPTRGGRYSSATYLVGEEDKTEYVIATNPKYRKQNVMYLKAAAHDLGIEVVDSRTGSMVTAAAGGRRAHKAGRKRAASPGTPGVAGTRAQDAALGVPDPYSVGAVPLDDVQGVVDKFDSAVQKQHQLVSSLTTTLKGIHVPHATKGNHRSVAAAKARIKDYKDHIRAAKYGGNWRNLHYRPLGDLDKEDKDAKADLAHIKHWNSQIAQLNARIDNDRTRMGTDSSAYTRTGDAKFLTDWRNSKADRAAAIKQLIGEDGSGGILGAAKDAASKLAAKYPSDSLNEWIGTLTGDIETASSDLEGDQGPEPGGPAAPSLDDFLSTSGQAGTLASLQRAYAVSQMNDVPDDPSTVGVNENAASLSDNLKTATDLQNFYKNLYNAAVAQGMPDSVVTDAANAYVQARDTATGISDTITQATQQAQQNLASDQTNYTSARADLYSQMGSNFAPIWAQTGPPPVGGFGGMGGAGQNNAAQPNTTQVSVVNNFEQPPPDPHTWSNGLSWELQAAV